MTNLLIDILPTTVDIKGVKYDIDTNFRTSILFEMLMQDVDLSIEEKIIQALDLYYSSIPDDIELAVDAILKFYSMNKYENDISEYKGKSGNYKRIYSFEYDDEYIYSAFLNQYNIDLNTIDYLHWWKFSAMFKCLKDDNMIVKIMEYRSIEITPDMSNEQKDFYRKMKKRYKLPELISKDESDKLKAINEALKNGEDVSKLL